SKEGVKIERESKTLATVTFQNYFRLYNKLSGMTGTAMTEEAELREIYNLDVIEIPTNKPIQRVDHQDSIFKTQEGKYKAAVRQIIECHEKGQPVLVGTISIEDSELLSKRLKKQGIKHEVLNAKQHDREAEIVAQAGKKGAVTIATNMAGRGTDIVLGGNAEFMAKNEMRKKGFSEELINEATGFSETDDEEILEARRTFTELEKKFKEQTDAEAQEVKAAGGLFILGTERHESRRIDNQLRGRAGRQGDEGESRFFISLEDDLMRLFGGDRIQGLMNTLGIEEDMPIENKMLTNTIESSQRKVEGKNFSIRKNVLNFDDVMSAQREIIYSQRKKVLDGDDIKDSIINMIKDTITETVNLYLFDDEVHDDWNLQGLRDHFMGMLTTEDDLKYDGEELSEITREEIADTLIDRAMQIYEDREKEFGSDTMREIERVVLLRTVDSKWMQHIDDMEELKQGIYLRAYGQKNPVVEYRIEGFDMFDEMIRAIREETSRLVLSVQLKKDEAPKREQVAKPTSANLGSDGEKSTTVTKKKVGRNEPCPCGSGKKYKKCCGQE
ncbi:MAG: preprotein translocase subunit SecA, partial [Clostridiales bacterium]|nr:preprotein translocase subunit SecA [Clostridiales bacterium]